MSTFEELPARTAKSVDGREWLVSVAHEKLLWLHGSQEDLNELLATAPSTQVLTDPGYRGLR